MKRRRGYGDINGHAYRDWVAGESTARYGGLAALREYDAGYRQEKTDSLFYVRALLALSVVCLLWIGFHEALHYLSCVLSGNRAYLASVLPTPSVACLQAAPLTPLWAFVYCMSPYIAAVVVMCVFCCVDGWLMRLIPYTAFFDLQYNLFATSLLGGELNGRENDVLSMTGYLQGMDPSGFYPHVCGGVVAFLVGLSFFVFYYGYRGDLSDSRYRGLFIMSFLFYTLFYVSGTVFLYV